MDDYCKTLFELTHEVNVDYEKLTLEKKMVVQRELEKWIDENEDMGHLQYLVVIKVRSIIDNIKKENE